MADIRIKDLAVTAGSSASDDYLAVDGSTNGTRKLSAYSPTFGGNLTVSGTGAFTANTNAPYSVSVTNSSTGASAYSQLSALNSTGTLTSIQTASTGFSGYGAWTSGSSLLYSNTGKLVLMADSGLIDFVSGGITATMRLNGAGNLLIGTTTDTGYKLNVKGANDAQMMLDVASGSQYTTLAFANNGSGKGFVYWDNTNNGLFAGTYSANASLKFNTGLGVHALTLDSSQNATFSGNVTAQKSSGSDVVLALNQIGIGQWTFKNEATTGNFKLSIGGNDWVTVNPTTGATTLPGSIAIGNTVNTVSPTSPNRTITMVIGGTTYYIHAKTTNN